MARPQPGDYVLHKEFGSDPPVWPAVVIDDDLAPEEVKKQRPAAWFTLILLIRQPYQFRWAIPRHLSALGHTHDIDAPTNSKELEEALVAAHSMQDAGLGLEYWSGEVAGLYRTTPEGSVDDDFDREQLQEALRISMESYHASAAPAALAPPGPSSGASNRFQQQLSPSNETILIEDDSDLDGDSEVQEAIRMSMGSHHGSVAPESPGPRSSPSNPFQQRLSPDRETILIEDDSEEGERSETESFGRPRDRPRPSQEIPRPFSQLDSVQSAFQPGSHDELPLRRPQRMDSLTSRVNNADSTQKAPASFFDQVLGRGSLGQDSFTPQNDTIDGDISESEDFVRVLGPGNEIRTLHKKDVWNRTYFRDLRLGTNYFDINEEKLWELRHPRLMELEADEFHYVVQYLTDGDFGIRLPADPEHTQEAIDQCVSTWMAAEKLGMYDLLEHIYEKVKFIEWDHREVLGFAVIVYGNPDPCYPIQASMKDWISEYLAHHVWSFIRDEYLASDFRKRLRSLRKLERDVFAKRVGILDAETEMDEDDEGEEDDTNEDDGPGEDNMDYEMVL